jgi:hypothetical protein
MYIIDIYQLACPKASKGGNPTTGLASFCQATGWRDSTAFKSQRKNFGETLQMLALDENMSLGLRHKRLMILFIIKISFGNG